MAAKTLLLIEPFCSGSHKQLIDLLHKEVVGAELISLPGKKWQWKARTSALWLSQTIPTQHNFSTMFASSVLNLAELVALRSDLAALHKILYFHENQLVYPVRRQQDRDFQFGYNQILSSMVADVVLFNSKHNMDSFLDNINSHLKLIPHHWPQGIPEQLRPKCHVLHFPIIFPSPCDDGGDAACDGGDAACGGDDAGNDTGVYEDLNAIAKDSSIEPTACLAAESNNSRITPNPGMSINTTHELIPNIKSVQNMQNTYKKTDSEITICVTSTLEESGNKVDMTSELVVKAESKAVFEQSSTDYETDGTACEELSRKKNKVTRRRGPLHIVWPHRWEHDKDPETFFSLLTRLQSDGLDFRISVLGETYSEVPDIFEESRQLLKDKILNWGFLPSKERYYNVLKSADCVVSTANHEFFGVAMLEAVHLGCYPLCPNKLVYPEIFPKECLYNTKQQLFKRLRDYCRRPDVPRSKPVMVDTSLYSWDTLNDQFLKFLLV